MTIQNGLLHTLTIYHAITNGTNKLNCQALSVTITLVPLAKWHSVNVTGVLPVVGPQSSQSTTNITKLSAAIQGQQNPTDKLQEAIFKSSPSASSYNISK